jgi:hypothetical protein
MEMLKANGRRHCMAMPCPLPTADAAVRVPHKQLSFAKAAFEIPAFEPADLPVLKCAAKSG